MWTLDQGTDPNSPLNFLIPAKITEAYLAKVIAQHGEAPVKAFVESRQNIATRDDLVALGRQRAAKVLGLQDPASAAVIEALCDRIEQLEAEVY